SGVPFLSRGKSHIAIPGDALRFSHARVWPEHTNGGSTMAPQSEARTLYVLVSSLAGTVLSLAATWIFVAHSVQPMVAYGGTCHAARLSEAPRALFLSLPYHSS